MNFWDLNPNQAATRQGAMSPRAGAGESTNNLGSGRLPGLVHAVLAATLLGLMALGQAARAEERPADVTAFVEAQHDEIAAQGAAALLEIHRELTEGGQAWTSAFLAGQVHGPARRRVLVQGAMDPTRAISPPFVGANAHQPIQARTDT